MPQIRTHGQSFKELHSQRSPQTSGIQQVGFFAMRDVEDTRMSVLDKRLKQLVHENTWKHRMSPSQASNGARQAFHSRSSHANRFY